jgi:NADH:ubiquinone oxidoreductase subunit H
MTPLVILFFVLSLAETNRSPFDLAEAEAELVAGYNIEFSSFAFVLFFLTEYLNILLLCAVFANNFLGNSIFLKIIVFLVYKYNLPSILILFFSSFIFSLKIFFMAYFIVLVRASLPRIRFDQLLELCWKELLPLAFSLCIFYIGLSIVAIRFFLYFFFEL